MQRCQKYLIIKWHLRSQGSHQIRMCCTFSQVCMPQKHVNACKTLSVHTAAIKTVRRKKGTQTLNILPSIMTALVLCRQMPSTAIPCYESTGLHAHATPLLNQTPTLKQQAQLSPHIFCQCCNQSSQLITKPNYNAEPDC